MSRDGFSSKNLIIILFIVFSIIGVLVIGYAIKSPTNTRSQASSGCTEKPEMVLESTDKYTGLTIYHLKLINNCLEQDQFSIKVKSFPEAPEKNENWSWKFKDGEWNYPYMTEALTGTTDLSLTIKVPMGNSGLPEKIQSGIYSFFVVEAAPANKPSLSAELELTYSVE